MRFEWQIEDTFVVFNPEFIYVTTPHNHVLLKIKGYPAEYLREIASGSGSDSEGRKLSKSMSCKVCPPDCPNCTSGEPCLVEYNMHLRGVPLAMQTFSITTALLLGFLTFRLRRTRDDHYFLQGYITIPDSLGSEHKPAEGT
ncbi:unnamed protein product [Rodentolepis nana]|uniref:Ionotropic receptor n=1 Tax=Rodentolepis nana TaxID=102285 RepID=A0A0R3TVI5_RODNA|nr:unnamed protein product [Rodentolepis nana]